jgi:hypothetical protein
LPPGIPLPPLPGLPLPLPFGSGFPKRDLSGLNIWPAGIIAQDGITEALKKMKTLSSAEKSVFSEKTGFCGERFQRQSVSH